VRWINERWLCNLGPPELTSGLFVFSIPLWVLEFAHGTHGFLRLWLLLCPITSKPKRSRRPCADLIKSWTISALYARFLPGLAVRTPRTGKCSHG
jgi:hypothetical protein